MLLNCYIWELKNRKRLKICDKDFGFNPDRNENPALFCADCNGERENG
jgi:hypothetical protein